MASVTFKRGTRAEIEATAKQDGQILMETDQNKKNKMYIDLPDGSRVLIGNSGEAIDTSYDNTTSGLDATNVQNAIDELDSTVDTLNSNFEDITTWKSAQIDSSFTNNNWKNIFNNAKNEFIFVFSRTSPPFETYTIHIPKNIIDDNEKSFQTGGAYNTSSLTHIQIKLTKTEFSSIGFYVNGSAVICNLYVYYR